LAHVGAVNRLRDCAAFGRRNGVPSTVLWFADCELQVARRELRVGGRSRKIEPKAFDVLTYLCVHRTRVVDRRELIDAIWTPGKVLDAVLGTSIMKARRAIDDNDAGRPIIGTWHRRGYRVVADVHMTTLGAQGLGDAVLPDSRRQSIAVLPFENLTGRHDLIWAEYGLSNTLADAIADVAGVSVLSPMDVLVLIAGCGRGLDPGARARLVSNKLQAKRVVSVRVRGRDSEFEFEYIVFQDDRVLRTGTLHGADAVQLTLQIASAIRHDLAEASYR